MKSVLYRKNVLRSRQRSLSNVLLTMPDSTVTLANQNARGAVFTITAETKILPFLTCWGSVPDSVGSRWTLLFTARPTTLRLFDLEKVTEEQRFLTSTLEEALGRIPAVAAQSEVLLCHHGLLTPSSLHCVKT